MAKDWGWNCRLICTACKAFQRYESGQTGVYLPFSTFLVSKGIHHYPLITFRGNRFNVLFHNAGALYYIAPLAIEFLEVWGAVNQLLWAVIADLTVPEYIAGCRALGLVSKCVTGSLWRLLASPDVSILDMSHWYQHMPDMFEVWSNDGSQVVTGKAVILSEVPTMKGSTWPSCEQFPSYLQVWFLCNILFQLKKAAMSSFSSTLISELSSVAAWF